MSRYGGQAKERGVGGRGGAVGRERQRKGGFGEGRGLQRRYFLLPPGSLNARKMDKKLWVCVCFFLLRSTAFSRLSREGCGLFCSEPSLPAQGKSEGRADQQAQVCHSLQEAWGEHPAEGQGDCAPHTGRSSHPLRGDRRHKDTTASLRRPGLTSWVQPCYEESSHLGRGQEGSSREGVAAAWG